MFSDLSVIKSVCSVHSGCRGQFRRNTIPFIPKTDFKVSEEHEYRLSEYYYSGRVPKECALNINTRESKKHAINNNVSRIHPPKGIFHPTLTVQWFPRPSSICLTDYIAWSLYLLIAGITEKATCGTKGVFCYTSTAWPTVSMRKEMRTPGHWKKKNRKGCQQLTYITYRSTMTWATRHVTKAF